MGKYKNTSFNASWLCEKEFKDWLEKVENDPMSARCSLCKRTFALSNMGRKACKSHASAAKHQAAAKEKRTAAENQAMYESADIRNHLTRPPASSISNAGISATASNSSDAPEQADENPEQVDNQSTTALNPEETASSQRASASSQRASVSSQQACGSSQRWYEKDEITKAEIRWCLHAVTSHLSLSAAGKSVDVFKAMFPDSEIAQGMALQRSKLAYEIVYGLSPYYRQALFEDIDLNIPFSISFDESLNKISQKSQMDVLIRYWSKLQDLSVSKYVGSSFLGHTKAVDLLGGLKQQIYDVNLKKMIQVSMDGPYVNLKLYRDLMAEMKEKYVDIPELVDLGTCSLHTLNNGFKAGLRSTGWELAGFLSGSYHVFKDVPSRRDDYTRWSESDLFPLRFCPHRWLQNGPVAERALAILPCLEKYVKGVKDEKVEPTSESYGKMVKGVNDSLMPCRLAFMHTIAAEVEPYLTLFQSEAPMVPFLYPELTKLVKSLLLRIVKQDVIDSSASLHRIDVKKSENLLPTKDVKVGHEVKAALSAVRSKTKSVKDKDILLFKQDCKTFIQVLLAKLFEKSPLVYSVTKNLSFCDPRLVASSPGTAKARFSALLTVLVAKGWVAGIQADRVEREFEELCLKQGVQALALTYDLKVARLDVFWKDIFNAFEVSGDLRSILKTVFVLSHGQASVERGFSVNKEILVENLSEKSLVAQRLVWQGVQQAGGVCNVLIDKKMIQYARSARTWYREDLIRHKKARETEEEEMIKKRKAKEQVESLKRKRLAVAAQMEALDEEIRTLAAQAAKY